MKGGCVMGVIGLVVGGLVGAVLPIHFERVRVRGAEAVQLKVMGAVVRESVGGPGELNRALSDMRAVLVGGLGVLGAVGLGGIAALMSSGARKSSPLPLPPLPSPVPPPPARTAPTDPHAGDKPPPAPERSVEPPADPHARYKPPPGWKPTEPGAAPDPPA